MMIPIFVTALAFGFMAAELRLSRANERRLAAEGAIRPAGDVYASMAILYPACFLAMGVEGGWRAYGSAAATGGPSWLASGVVLFLASKGLKYWAIGSLGHRWSFRVWILPGKPLVSSGPYRYVTHPNYIAIVGELAGMAMMVEAPVTGTAAVVVFGVMLLLRIRFENRVLAMVRAAMDGQARSEERRR